MGSSERFDTGPEDISPLIQTGYAVGMPPIHVWDIDSGHVQASSQRVYYTYSRAEASPRNIDSMVANLEDFVRASKRPVGYLLQLSAKARPPSAADRNRVTQMFNDCAYRLAGVAVVVEAEGFSGALLRSALTTVFTISRKGFVVRIFASVKDAAGWLASSLGTEASDIVDLADDARERLKAMLSVQPIGT